MKFFYPGARTLYSGFVLLLKDMLLNVRSTQMACKWCPIKTRENEARRHENDKHYISGGEITPNLCLIC